MFSHFKDIEKSDRQSTNVPTASNSVLESWIKVPDEKLKLLLGERHDCIIGQTFTAMSSATNCISIYYIYIYVYSEILIHIYIYIHIKYIENTYSTCMCCHLGWASHLPAASYLPDTYLPAGWHDAFSQSFAGFACL